MSTYSMIEVLMASPTEPLSEEKRRHQLTIMFDAMHNLERAPNPSDQDWNRVNNALLIMEALLNMGLIQDPDGLLLDAVEALGKAGFRSMEGQVLRLDAKDIQTVRGMLQDYAELLEVIPARTMLQAHRRAEQRVMKIIKRKK